jgi:hypothetical protein
MKKLFILLFLAGVPAICCASRVPIVGIWKWRPVVEADQRTVVRKSYIFTEQALSERTVFSALHDNTDGYTVICCLEVSNLTPLDLKAVASKYEHDPIFVGHLDSVKGAPFMYEAHPIARQHLSPLLASLTADHRVPADTSPFYAPVISGIFDKKDIPNRFNIGGTAITLKEIVNRDSARITYKFSIGKRVVRLSDQVDLGD